MLNSTQIETMKNFCPVEETNKRNGGTMRVLQKAIPDRIMPYHLGCCCWIPNQLILMNRKTKIDKVQIYSKANYAVS